MMKIAAQLRSEAEMRWKLEQMASFYGSQDTLARALNISPQYLCDVLKGRRSVSANLAQKLGYRRRVMFEEQHNDQ